MSYIEKALQQVLSTNQIHIVQVCQDIEYISEDSK